MATIPFDRERTRRQTTIGWRTRVALVVVIAALFGRSAVAQDVTPAQDAPTDIRDLSELGLEDLLHVKVYAASKFLQDQAQAPASVTVIRAEEIRRQGYRTLADIFRGVRGFYVTYDRDYSYVGVRGFLRPGDFNSRILLLVNGHRMNDNVFDQALLGTESPIDVSLIERVEVIRGPSSSLYGTSAFFAVVNLITRTGHALGQTEVEVETGSQTFGRGRFAAGGRNAKGYEGLVSLTAFGSDGNSRLYYPEFDLPPSSNGVAVDADRDRGASLFATGSRGALTAQISIGSRAKRIPTAAFETIFNDTRTETRDSRGFADLQYLKQLDPRTRVDLRASYDQYDYVGHFAYESGLFLDDARGRWVTGEANVVRQIGRHGLTVGTDYRYNLRQNQSAVDESGVLLDDRRRSRSAALFAEDEFRVGPRVLVNAGLRWDEVLRDLRRHCQSARRRHRHAAPGKHVEGNLRSRLPRAEPLRAVPTTRTRSARI
ncbi:MAG: TonB-dependent receptor [Vicinamibacterales bacterium]